MLQVRQKKRAPGSCLQARLQTYENLYYSIKNKILSLNLLKLQVLNFPIFINITLMYFYLQHYNNYDISYSEKKKYNKTFITIRTNKSERLWNQVLKFYNK